MFLSRGDRDLGVAFQAPPGSQASSRGEAKDSALLSSRDAALLEPPERPQGSPASSSVWREDPVTLMLNMPEVPNLCVFQLECVCVSFWVWIFRIDFLED